MDKNHVEEERAIKERELNEEERMTMERKNARQERIKYSEKTMSDEERIGFSLYKDEIP